MALLVPVVPSFRFGEPGSVRRLLHGGFALLLLGLCATAHALAPDRALSQLRHDRWTPDQGAPAQVMSIAQTPDGFLWLGSRQGLYRFDGLRFERITQIAGKPMSDDDILNLFADEDGSVWIGYVSGGMSRMGGPRPANYAYQREDVPVGSVIGFGRDATGRLWAATSGTIVYLDLATDTWKTSRDMGFDPAWSPRRLFVDREKGVWVAFSNGAQHGIAHLAPGATRFERVPQSIETPFFDQAPNGTLWAVDEWGARPLAQAMPLPGHAGATTFSWLAADFKGAGLRFDRDGVMWLATADGIARVRDPAKLHAPDKTHPAPSPEYFGTAQGLTSEVVWTLFEDREGNIWTGTANGLDRFRENALAAIRLPRREQAFSIEADRSGRIWAGNPDQGPMRVTPDADQATGAVVQEVGGADDGVTALHRDGAGNLWVGDADGGLWRSDGAGLRPVPLPPEVAGGGRIVTMASDHAGGLWLSKVNGGLLRFHEGKWEAQNAKYGMDAGTAPRALVEDAQGRIWSDAGQTIRVFEHGGHRDFDEDGPGVGRIAVLRAWKSELWIGGVQGVAARIGEHFQRLLGRGGETFERTAGIVMLANGEAWFIGRPGVTRVPASEMARWRVQPSYRVAFDRFGVLDGLRGAAEQSGASPVAAADGQGRVWFATSRGVHWIDPRQLQHGNASPGAAPVVLALHVDEKELSLASSPTLPAGSRDLRIGYTAPFLRRPEQARFRYRLDGLDDDWHDAGARRQALYSRLAPGSYRFRLMASDGAQAWSGREAAFTFEVLPAFWQTWWFALACLAVTLLLVWWLVRWRVAIAREGLQRAYRARIGERERIARDLHDTLLQSMQALVFLVDAARGRLERGDGEAAKTGLSRAIREANAGLVESRDRIRDLRQQGAESQDLAAALRDLPKKLDMPPDFAYEFSTWGRPVRWHAPEQDEVYRIVREAVANAVRHAGARHIRVRVTGGWLGVLVEVEDDGCGIEANLLARGNRDGHWGLTGMRERARLLGATLSVTSRPAEGTVVRLRLLRWRVIRGIGV
ncbi:two-component system sensor protein [Xanthomonas sp. GW]|uniref:sensor histidine kinase n=1 Tax=Xanthomonas sp. GW TaxID=2724121 RepID=UPI0016399300|nr:two-component regulator propeller domain-containing protein [Xanthomonas sp. GW]QNH21294.1 two-component system sensor protein [Xanthomonas sp. GW]